MACVDWVATLRRASFRGVPFQVETDEFEFGRRIIVHEFYGRSHATEDAGPATQRFTVTAYIASDDGLALQKALVAACNTEGPATLQLPSESPMQVVAGQCRRAFNKDQLGYFAFQLDFIKANISFGPLPIRLFEREVITAAANITGSIRDAFLSAYSTIGEVPWIIEAAVGTIQDVFSTVDLARTAVSVDAVKGSALAQAILSAYDSARSLAMDGRGPVGGLVAQGIASPIGKVSSDAYVGAAYNGTYGSGAYADAVLDVVQQLGEAATDQIAVVNALEGLSTFGLDLVSPTALSESGKANDRNIDALGGVLRQAALVEMAVQASVAELPDRPTAIRVRAQVAQAFERELSSLGGQGDLYSKLDAVRGLAVQAISRKITDLKPTVTVESNSSMPSIVWAYRLYGDASKATALISRNRVRHPSYMPTIFEAESPS